MRIVIKTILAIALSILLTTSSTIREAQANTDNLKLTYEPLSIGFLGKWKANISCSENSGPYYEEGDLSDPVFILNIWPHRASFSASLVIEGTICNYLESASYTFLANNLFSIASKGGAVILSPSSHSSCPLPGDVFRSLIADLGFENTYQYTFNGNSITAVALDDSYCARYGQPGAKATLTLSRL